VLYNFNRMRPGKTTHIFEVGYHSVKFSGNFDSGNLRNVRQIGSDEVISYSFSFKLNLLTTHMNFLPQIRLFFTSVWKTFLFNKTFG